MLSKQTGKSTTLRNKRKAKYDGLGVFIVIDITLYSCDRRGQGTGEPIIYTLKKYKTKNKQTKAN